MKRRTEGTELGIGLGMALALSACGGAEVADAGLEVVRRDSAGVEIVENLAGPSELPEWSLASEPLRRLGALDGPPELQFYRVADVSRLGDGTLVVANGGSSEIRVFRPDGRLRSSFGSEGEGPGEFGWIQAVWPMAGDTVLAFDRRHQRLTRWTLDGELGGTSPLDPHLTNPILAAGRFSDGSILVGETSWEREGDGFEWRPLRLHRYAADGSALDTITEVRGQLIGSVQFRGAVGIGSPHFAVPTQATAVGDRIMTSTVEGFELRELDLEGNLRRSIRWRGRDPTVTDQDVERFLEDRLAELEGDDSRARTRELIEAFPTAERFRAVSGLRSGPAGGVWAREYGRPRDPPGERWLAFDATGRILGRLRLPDRVRLRAVGEDHLIVVERDELDVEYVAIYDLPWAPTGSGGAG